jgi:NADH-quinone oxidoreductase subunit M
MGGYGFLRLGLPILPGAAAAFAPLISWFSVAAILYGGYLALAQTDLKKLIAYSSISHMGFVTLGIFTFTGQGIQGAVLQMFNHGITTGALFLAVGLLYDRTHSRAIGDYGGLHAPMPRFAAFLSLFSVASFGLPGTSNFIGEFLVLVGTSYQSFAKVLLAMGGIVLAAAYMLWMLQRVILGPTPSRAMGLLPDLTTREILVLAPLAILTFGIGLYPSPLMKTMDGTVTALVEQIPPAMRPAVIIGSSMFEGPGYVLSTNVKGLVRSFDVRTDKQAWRFDTMPGAGREVPRDVGQGLLPLDRKHRRLGADHRGSGSWPRLPAGQVADDRRVRRQPAE